MNKLIIFITGTLLPFYSFGQLDFTGIIKDTVTNQVLPYAHIISAKGETTLSNKEGIFQLSNISKPIHFSAIGYEDKYLTLSSKDTVIYLNPIAYLLPEISVVPKKTKLVEIGTITKGRVRNSFSSKGESYQIAKFIANEIGVESILESISFYLVYKTKRSQEVRLLIMSKDSTTSMPAYMTIPISKIIKVGRKKGWIEIDIADLQLPFPKDGFYVGLEFLESNHEIDSNNQVHLGLFPFEKEALTYIKFLGDTWNIPPFLNDSKEGQLNLMIRAKVHVPIE